MNTQKCVQYETFTLRDNMYLREKTFLELIAYSKDKIQKYQIIKCINHDQYFELKKIAINILHGVIPLKKNQLKYLKNSKQFIRKLAEGKAKNSHLAQHFMVLCYIVKIALQYNEKYSEISFSSNRKVGKIRTKKNEPVKEVLVKTVPLKNHLPQMKVQVENQLPQMKVQGKNQLGQGIVTTSLEHQIFPYMCLKKRNKSLSLLYYLKKTRI